MYPSLPRIYCPNPERQPVPCLFLFYIFFAGGGWPGIAGPLSGALSSLSLGAPAAANPLAAAAEDAAGHLSVRSPDARSPVTGLDARRGPAARCRAAGHGADRPDDRQRVKPEPGGRGGRPALGPMPRPRLLVRQLSVSAAAAVSILVIAINTRYISFNIIIEY